MDILNAQYPAFLPWLLFLCAFAMWLVERAVVRQLRKQLEAREKAIRELMAAESPVLTSIHELATERNVEESSVHGSPVDDRPLMRERAVVRATARWNMPAAVVSV